MYNPNYNSNYNPYYNLYHPTDTNSGFYYSYSNQNAYTYPNNQPQSNIGHYQYQHAIDTTPYQQQSYQSIQPYATHNIDYQVQNLETLYNRNNQQVYSNLITNENKGTVVENSESSTESEFDESRSESESDESIESSDMDNIDNILLNTAETVVSTETIRDNSTLYKNQVFNSYNDFEYAFKKYCRETYQVFSIRKSQKHSVIGERNSDDSVDTESEIYYSNDTPYKLVLFQCYRSKYEPKSRGEKIRNCQKYSGCGCKATIRLNLENRGQHQGQYKIKTFNIEHNHPIIKEHYLLHPKNRQLPPELKSLAKDMLGTGSKAAEVAMLMSQRSGNFIISKDLHNLNRALYTKSESAKLKEVIDQQIKRDNNKDYFQYIQSEDQTELYGIFYQNNFMRSVFKTYGRIMFIDGTYKLNQNNYPCIVFVVVDHNRHSRIVAFALVACERLIILESILNFFKKLNDVSRLEFVMIDKDLKEDSAITSFFPDAQILYCFWHVEKTFKLKLKKEAYQCAKEIMLAESETEFNEKFNKFKQLECNNKKSLEYLEENWLNCKEKWAKYLRHGCSLDMQETNNPVESINKQIKGFSRKHSTSTLAKCLSSIFKYLKSSGINHVVTSFQETHIVKIQGDHPLVNEFYKFVPKYLGNWLAIEYEKSTTEKYSLSHSESESSVMINNEKYKISNLEDDHNVACSCYPNSSLNLPCSHIFFARKEMKMTLFTERMIPDRHKLRQNLLQVEENNLNLVTTIPNINNIKSFITSKNMNSKDKYNAFIRLCQELGNLVKNLKQDEFETCMSKILKIKVMLKNKDIDTEIDKEDDQDKTIISQVNFENNPIPDDEISCSQSSQFSTTSTTSAASFDLSKKKLIDGIAVGRKSSKKYTNLQSKGQISKYSEIPKKSTRDKSISNIDRGQFKSAFENRAFQFLQEALINGEMAEAVIKKNRCVDEDHIVVDHQRISAKSFFLYQQFLKSSSEFKSFFTAEGLDQLESTLNIYKTSKACAKCTNNFSIRDIIKVCSECFSLYNLTCAVNTKKKFICDNCDK